MNTLSSLYSYQPGMEWNPVEKIIMERRSIRLFKKDIPSNDMIRRVLEAGRFAPSAGNAQPWKFIVIKDNDVITQMERDTIKFTQMIMWCIDYQRSPLRRLLLKPVVKCLTWLRPNELHPIPFNLMIQIASEKVPVFHSAPVIILILIDRRGVGTPALDAGICGQNMVLAAHSLGLGTCWVGMVSVLVKHPYWKSYFNIAYPYDLKSCLILGWPEGYYDGEVSREVQMVEWYDSGEHRIERQGT